MSTPSETERKDEGTSTHEPINVEKIVSQAGTSLADNDVESKAEPAQEEKPQAAEEAKRESPFLSKDKKISPFLVSKPETEEEQPAEEAAEDEDGASAISREWKSVLKVVEGTALFYSTCQLYFLSTVTQELETRGEGLIVIHSDASGLYRVLMIREKIMFKGCNHYIAPQCPLSESKKVKNSWLWCAINDRADVENNEKKTTFFVTFNNNEDFTKFGKAYNTAMEKNAEIFRAKLSKVQK